MHVDARICPHCRSSQGWWGSQRDPRFAIGWLAISLLVFVPLAFYLPHHLFSDEQPVVAPVLVVSDVSSRVVATSDGPRLYILGSVRNTSSSDASRVWFRVRVLDGSGKLVDTMLLQDSGLLVPSGKAVSFRVSDSLSVPSADPGHIEVMVERARPTSRWE
jgi:hypothetical protein